MYHKYEGTLITFLTDAHTLKYRAYISSIKNRIPSSRNQDNLNMNGTNQLVSHLDNVKSLAENKKHPHRPEVSLAIQETPKHMFQKRREVIMAVKNQTVVFWVITPCRLIGRNLCFVGTYYLQLQCRRQRHFVPQNGCSCIPDYTVI